MVVSLVAALADGSPMDGDRGVSTAFALPSGSDGTLALAKAEVKQGSVFGSLKHALVGKKTDGTAAGAAGAAGAGAAQGGASSGEGGSGRTGGLWGKMKESVSSDQSARDSGPMCFPGTGRVWARNKGELTIAEVQTGDAILTSSGFSKIVGFLHREPGNLGFYRSIEIAGGARLTVSGEHILFVKEQGTGETLNIPASLVKPKKHRLLKLDALNGTFVAVEITGITEGVEAPGIYAPLTESGDLVVDGFWCSCYATPLNWGLTNTHWLSDWIMAPLKTEAAGRADAGPQGIPLYAQSLFRLANGVLA